MTTLLGGVFCVQVSEKGRLLVRISGANLARRALDLSLDHVGFDTMAWPIWMLPKQWHHKMR